MMTTKDVCKLYNVTVTALRKRAEARGVPKNYNSDGMRVYTDDEVRLLYVKPRKQCKGHVPQNKVFFRVCVRSMLGTLFVKKAGIGRIEALSVLRNYDKSDVCAMMISCDRNNLKIYNRCESRRMKYITKLGKIND